MLLMGGEVGSYEVTQPLPDKLKHGLRYGLWAAERLRSFCLGSFHTQNGSNK